MNEANFFWKNTRDSWENITRMDEENSERYMKRRLTILEGKDKQDDSEQVGGGYFFSESLKIDLPTF